FAVLLGFAAPARGDDVSAAQSVIQAQEQAFSRGDAAAAYSHAAPEIKQLLPQADMLLQTVQGACPAACRRQSLELGKARAGQRQASGGGCSGGACRVENRA